MCAIKNFKRFFSVFFYQKHTYIILVNILLLIWWTILNFVVCFLSIRCKMRQNVYFDVLFSHLHVMHQKSPEFQEETELDYESYITSLATQLFWWHHIDRPGRPLMAFIANKVKRAKRATFSNQHATEPPQVSLKEFISVNVNIATRDTVQIESLWHYFVLKQIIIFIPCVIRLVLVWFLLLFE